MDWIIFVRSYLYLYRLIIIYCSRNLEVHPLSLRFFWKKKKNFDEAQCSFFMVYSCKMFFIAFFFSLMHSFRGNAGIDFLRKNPCMLDTTICIWLWPQLNWCSTYSSVRKFLKKSKIIVISIFNDWTSPRKFSCF